MEQNIVVNGEYTETDPLNVHNKFTKSSQQYIKIKPLCLNQSLRGKLSSWTQRKKTGLQCKYKCTASVHFGTSYKWTQCTLCDLKTVDTFQIKREGEPVNNCHECVYGMHVVLNFLLSSLHIGYIIAFRRYRRKFWWFTIIFSISGEFPGAFFCESLIFSP